MLFKNNSIKQLQDLKYRIKNMQHGSKNQTRARF